MGHTAAVGSSPTTTMRAKERSEVEAQVMRTKTKTMATTTMVIISTPPLTTLGIQQHQRWCPDSAAATIYQKEKRW